MIHHPECDMGEDCTYTFTDWLSQRPQTGLPKSMRGDSEFSERARCGRETADLGGTQVNKGTHKWFVRFELDGAISGTVRRTKLKHEAIAEVQRAIPGARVFEAYRVSENGARI